MNYINFDKEFKKMTRGIQDHNFRHYNQSMGCMIYSKEHYRHEMKRRGMVPADMAEQLAENWDKANPRKEYGDLSPKARDIVSSLRLSADSNGNIVLGGRAIKALQEIGAVSRETPKDIVYNGKGGMFNG